MSLVDGFIAGSVAGAAGLIVGHPFDTVKVRLQTCPSYQGVSHCFRRIVAEEGVRALFRGMAAPLASVSVMNAIFFGLYDNVLQNLDPNKDKPKISSAYIAGTLSGIAAGLVSGPVELIKCRLQVASKVSIIPTAKLTNRDIIRTIIEQDGLRGLTRGIEVTIYRELISCGLYFATYEAIIQFFRGEDKTLGELNPLHLLAAGGTAGMVSWGVNYPVDVVKSRIQIDGFRGPAIYTSSASCFRQLRSEVGWRGLYRGVTATLVRAFPTNAVMLPAYSITMTLLEGFRNHHLTYQ